MASSKHRHEKVGKMGHLPGDIPRGDKIKMMEGASPFSAGGWVVSKNASKSFRKTILGKAKTRVKRRLDREMKGELESRS